MKLIDRIKKFRTETIVCAYILLISLAAGYAYAQKLSDREEIIQVTKVEVRQGPSEQTSLTVTTAFETCNEQFFSKYDNDDFLTLLKKDLLRDSWKLFFSQNIRIKQTPKECISLLKTLAKHNIRSSHLYSVHDLLHSENLQKVEEVISTGIISNLVLSGAEEQFRAVLNRLPSKTDDVNVSGYSLYQHMVNSYLVLLDKLRPTLNTPIGEIPEKTLEVYTIGKTYKLCGFNEPVLIKNGKDGYADSFHTIEPCSKNIYSASVKIIAIDDNWLEIEVPDAKDDEDEEEKAPKSRLYISRKSVTTPFVVSDGNIIIPLSETDVSNVQVRQSLMIVENRNTSCDNKDLAPVLRIYLSRNEDVKVLPKILPENDDGNEPTAYNYPIGFDRSKAYIKKNFYGSTHGEFECGT